MESLFMVLAIITGAFFAIRFHQQDRGWGWGLLYGLVLCPVAVVHLLTITVAAFFQAGGFSLFQRTPDSYVQTGIEHMMNEEYEKAVADFDKAIEVDPNIPHLYEVRGRTYALQSMYDRAIVDLNKAIQLMTESDRHLDELNPYYYRALVWVELEEYGRAIEDFSSSIEYHAKAEIYLGRGRAFTELRKFDRALEDFDQAIGLSPSAESYLARGRAHLNLGRHDKALSDFSVALKLDKLNPNAHIETAAAHYAKGEFRKAITELTNGISMTPDLMEVNANVLQEFSQEEQLEIYEAVVKDLAGLYAARGVCYLNVREYRQAIEDFEDAIKLDPQNGSYYRGRGGTYSQLMEHLRAIEDLDFAVRLCPEDSNSFFTRGIVRFNLEDFDSAIRDFDKAIELNPDFVDSYTGRGRCSLHLGQNSRAFADLDKAISLEGKKVVTPDLMNIVVISLDNSYAYAIRGLAYSMMGDEESAQRDFHKSTALGYDPAQIEEELQELGAQDSAMYQFEDESTSVADEREQDVVLTPPNRRGNEQREKSMTKVDAFMKRADELHSAARARGESAYGMKPWYCSVKLIEGGAKVAFIGSRPAGNVADYEADKRNGVLNKPYDDPEYQAWLDDTHWGKGTGITKEQKKVWTAFEILFGSSWRYTLQHTASFNVVASRFEDASHISTQTWMAGMAWCFDVLYQVSPDVIVCLGNGEPNGKSAWSIFRRAYNGTAMPTFRQEHVSGNYSLKHGRIVEGPLRGTEVVGLPQLYMPVNMDGLRSAAEKLGICPIIE